jgi:hypothetical protein
MSLQTYFGFMQEFKFLIRKQKYLELLEAGQVREAIVFLQKDITPLNVNTEERHKLSKLRDLT